MTPVHSRQGVGEAVERFAWAAGVYEDEQMLADINTIRAALADQSGDLTDMVSRPSLEMVSIPRGPAITDPEAFDDCLACNRPSLETPASDELSGVSGELPPASDVAGRRLVPVEPTEAMLEAGKTAGGLLFDARARDVWSAMIAAAPPHPASKEVGDE